MSAQESRQTQEETEKAVTIKTPSDGVAGSPVDPVAQPDWLSFIDSDEWLAFWELVVRAHRAGIPILVGGALGLAAYMPLRRHTKDVDFYVLPQDRSRFISVLNAAGFQDLYEREPYDRGWIYRGVRDGIIADVIWSFANRRADVDEDWFRYSREIACSGMLLRVVPAEELIWSKLFVIQRERCDWPDLLNLLYYAGSALDWERLRARLGQDEPLLRSLLAVFSWVSPEAGVPHESNALPAGECSRAMLLDSRPWFLPEIKT